MAQLTDRPVTLEKVREWVEQRVAERQERGDCYWEDDRTMVVVKDPDWPHFAMDDAILSLFKALEATRARLGSIATTHTHLAGGLTLPEIADAQAALAKLVRGDDE